MGDYIDQRKVFPRVLDNLLLLDYPSIGNQTPIRVDYLAISDYKYMTTAAVTATASGTSVYSANQINALVPNDGHLYLVLPTVNPQVVCGTFANPSSTGAAGVVAINSSADCNTRIANVAASGANTVVFAYESCRVRLNFPAAQPWWGLDTQSSGGAFDWLQTSPDNPNATYMWAITDAVKFGTIQMQFEMPVNNLSSSAGLYGNIRFYVGFVSFSLLKSIPSVYTPIPTQPPNQGSTYQAAVGARQFVSS